MLYLQNVKAVLNITLYMYMLSIVMFFSSSSLFNLNFSSLMSSAYFFPQPLPKPIYLFFIRCSYPASTSFLTDVPNRLFPFLAFLLLTIILCLWLLRLCCPPTASSSASNLCTLRHPFLCLGSLHPPSASPSAPNICILRHLVILSSA